MNPAARTVYRTALRIWYLSTSPNAGPNIGLFPVTMMKMLGVENTVPVPLMYGRRRRNSAQLTSPGGTGVVSDCLLYSNTGGRLE